MAGRRILVMDDEPNLRKVLSARLKANGFEVVTAEDGEDGIRKALEDPPALAIIDMAMPKKNGYQVCRALRAHALTKKLPIILLSAWVRSKEGEADELADVYMTKPFEAAELLRTIRGLLGNS